MRDSEKDRRFSVDHSGSEISGAVAQLGERLLCKQDVVGSIPSGSTTRAIPRGIVATRAIPKGSSLQPPPCGLASAIRRIVV
jgi:hypothetical protein